MPFISEEVIEQQLVHLQTEDQAFEQSLQLLQEEQPILAAFIFSENHEAFTETERELLLFLSVVIWQSVKAVQGEVGTITEEALSTAEEDNWAKMMDAPRGDFRSKLDVFFAETPQEDLMALVEDSLTAEDDDNHSSREGQEALFVALKSMIDVIAQP